MRFGCDGILSVWAGRFDSEDELFDYTDWKYDEDDEDAEPTNAFANHSGLGWFDHDFQEANFVGEHPSSPADVLEGHSYVESFRDEVASALAKLRRKEWNSLFLLYDCAYDPDRAHPSNASRLHYIGSFPYSKGEEPGGTEWRVRRVE